MKTIFKRYTVLFSHILFVTCAIATPLSKDDVQTTEKSLLPISLASFSCITMVVLLCLGLRNFFAKLCPDNSFKDLENEDAFFNDIAIATVPASFPMYPPVVNSTVEATTIGYNAERVYFEPLPDLSNQHKNRSFNWSNLGQVRPKIARLRADQRKDSMAVEEDYLVDAETRRTIEKIFSSNRQTFPRGQLQYIKELGSGWFGKVLQGEAHDIQPGKKKTKVMVMMLKEGVSNLDKSFFLQEAFAYREIENANVLKMFHQCVEASPLLTILEFCQNGDLKSFMLSRKSNIEQLTQQGTQLNMLCDVAAGLQCLHQYNFVHRDLAIRNCLVTSDLCVKIGDYGLAEQIFKEDYYHDQEGVGIPIRWMAPESLSVSDVLRVNRTTKEANIWTFGVVMWELLRCGDLPYADLNDLHVVRLVAKERVVKLNKPNVDVDNIGHLCEVMEMCWRYDPSTRPSIRELRIMLLHLLSNKHQADLDFFEEKWSQLKPRPVQASEESFANIQGLNNPIHGNPEAETRSPGKTHKDMGGNSFPILAPLANKLSPADKLDETTISEDLVAKNPRQNSPDEDEKSEASLLTGTEDGFEVVSVRKRAEDTDDIEKDKFSFVHIHEVERDDEGYNDERENPSNRSDQSKSPARPNFVNLSGRDEGSSFLSATPSDRSDSHNLMDEFSPMAPLSDSSLLKMDKYTNYLCTAVTSIENDDSFVDGNRTKASSEVSLHDSTGSLK